jgi:hypothetical protein
MTHDLPFWRRIDRALDPLHLPEPDEFTDRYEPHPDGPALRVLDDLEMSNDPTSLRVLLCGARGSGKTTELMFLQRKLAAMDGTAALYVDIATALPDDAGTAVWLPLVGAAVRVARNVPDHPKPHEDKLALAAAGVGITSEVFSNLLTLVTSLATFSGTPTGGTIATIATAASSATGALADLSRSVRTGLAEADKALPSEVDSLGAALRTEIDLLSQETGSKLVLLLDGLDRRPTSESVLRALHDAELLYKLPAGLVLSGPVQMRFDPRFAALTLPGALRSQTLTNLPVVTPEGKDHLPGQRVLERLLKKRLADEPAAASLFPAPIVRRAARASSGLPREFLELLRISARACRRGGRAEASTEDLDIAMKERRHAYQSGLTTDTWDVLATVLVTRERPRGDLDELLFVNHVACYPNGDVWFRPNELLIDYLQARAARAGRAT